MWLTLIGVTRQNMRKLMMTDAAAFPAPIHSGSASIWYLAHLLQFLGERGQYFNGFDGSRCRASCDARQHHQGSGTCRTHGRQAIGCARRLVEAWFVASSTRCRRTLSSERVLLDSRTRWPHRTMLPSDIRRGPPVSCLFDVQHCELSSSLHTSQVA